MIIEIRLGPFRDKTEINGGAVPIQDLDLAFTPFIRGDSYTKGEADGRFPKLTGGADADYTASPRIDGKPMFTGLKGIEVVAAMPGSPDPDILYFVEA